jgi:hypothetical protein
MQSMAHQPYRILGFVMTDSWVYQKWLRVMPEPHRLETRLLDRLNDDFPA